MRSETLLPAAVRVADRAPVPGPVLRAGRSEVVPDRARTIQSWLLLLLAFPAAAEVWSGWVGIAQKTGFGLVHLLRICAALRLAVAAARGSSCKRIFRFWTRYAWR